MKRLLTFALIAISAAVLITGCQTGLNSNPAGPSEIENTDSGSWDPDRASSFFPRVNVSYEPFDCTATVTWVTALPSNGNYLHYGNSSSGLY